MIYIHNCTHYSACESKSYIIIFRSPYYYSSYSLFFFLPILNNYFIFDLLDIEPLFKLYHIYYILFTFLFSTCIILFIRISIHLSLIFFQWETFHTALCFVFLNNTSTHVLGNTTVLSTPPLFIPLALLLSAFFSSPSLTFPPIDFNSFFESLLLENFC